MEASSSELRQALSTYSEALKLKSVHVKQSKDLVELDLWFRTTLRSSIEARELENDVYLTKEEMIELMKWKLARGKWRPSLQKYIESNPEDLILSTTRKAFLESNSPEIAIKSLCVMKGVGPATASAILSVFQYKTEPFFSDEAVEIILKLKADYTVKMLNSYRIGMQQRVKEDEFANAEELERACWAFCVQQRFGDKIEKVVKKRKKAENEEEEEEAVKSKPKLKKEKV